MFWWRVLLIGGLCFALALPASNLDAQPGNASLNTIQVNSTGDDLQQNGNCTLREAIQAANTDQAVDGCAAGSGVDTISLPAGTFTLSIEGTMENENKTGDLDILDGVKIVGAGMERTIVDADSIDRVFDVPTTGHDAEFTDLTIRGGYLGANLEWDGTDDPYGWGGGIRLAGPTNKLMLLRVWVTGNSVDEPVRGHGAGIYSGGPLEVRDSLFTDNEAAYEGGAITATRKLLVQNTDFDENYGYGSAAIQLHESSASGRIEDSNFANHICGPAAVGVISVDAQVALVINNVVIEQSDCEGSAILNNGDLTVTNSKFYGNKSQSGIIDHRSGKLLVRNTYFTGNGASAAMVTVTGGEAAIEQSFMTQNGGVGVLVKGGVVSVTNTTITNTTNQFEGGGIVVEDGSLRLESVTLANLQGDHAALQVSGGSVIVHNTLLGYNLKTSGETLDCRLAPGSTVSQGYNLISVGDECGWPKATGDQIGTRAAPLNPRLGGLTYSETGRTETLPPLPGSPAIDKGDPAQCPPIDQRGVPRPQGPRCDIGAHEVDAAQPVVQNQRMYIPSIRR